MSERDRARHQAGRFVYPKGGVTLYASVDGAIAGAVIAWLYNAFAGGREGGPA